MQPSATTPRVAVILPCYNEEAAIAKVVADFRAALPDAAIYVYDNNSSDKTAAIAATAGAIVRNEPMQGKGNVLRRMFADVEADVYVLSDADDTYPAEFAGGMVDALLNENLDMVVGVRREQEDDAYRFGHRFGNRFLNRCVQWIFGARFSDMLSGYRVFSRRFVKSFPTLVPGFEIETELTIHALTLRLPSLEIDVPYRARFEGTQSKLRTYRDGTRILLLILLMFKEYRPFSFFGALGVLLGFIAVAIALPLLPTYLETGLVPRFPTAILATGLAICAGLSMMSGIFLDSISRMRLESKRLTYLGIPSFSAPP